MNTAEAEARARKVERLVRHLLDVAEDAAIRQGWSEMLDAEAAATLLPHVRRLHPQDWSQIARLAGTRNPSTTTTGLVIAELDRLAHLTDSQEPQTA